MITLAEAETATGGRWLAQPFPPATPLAGGAFDTRVLASEEIFFALAGESGDGHDHLGQLAGSGVKLAVVGRDVSRDVELKGFSGAVLRTGDPLAALGDMARFLVGKYKPAIVAVTGSYGKTTAKEIIAHVLEGGRTVLKSPGSLNNEIGVPVTLLRLDGCQDSVVLEFSARKPGDIDYLGSIAPPDVAILLGVGHAHIGVFGSLDAIYGSKGEIFHHLKPGGLALVGSAQPRLRELAGARRTLTFGRDGGDFHAEDLTLDGEGRQNFTAVHTTAVHTSGIHGETRLGLRAGFPGPHGCEPVLAAWAVARELGLPDEVFRERAGVVPAQKGRLSLLRSPGGACLIDDSYNASPETVVNLIETLNARPERVKVLVLGPLAELEEGLADSARAIAAGLRPPLTRCLVYDPRSPVLFDRLRAELPEHELPEHGGTELLWFEDPSALVEALREMDTPFCAMGVKGARSAHMERIVQALLDVPVVCGKHPCSLLRYCTDCNELTGK